ncbi:MAG: hypothetical protein EXS37_02180 [Opitutus sp.]|nr:hypothetical protein [Opitutus sp.]
MTTSEKSRLLKINSACWIAAMILPIILQLSLGSTKFPWPILIPMLLLGPLLASNQMLSKAIGHPTDDASPNESRRETAS